MNKETISRIGIAAGVAVAVILIGIAVKLFLGESGFSLRQVEPEYVPVTKLLVSYEEAAHRGLLFVSRPDAVRGDTVKLVGAAQNGIYQTYYTDLPSEGRSSFSTIVSCKINAETSQVELQYTVPKIPKSDDNNLYIFELATYETSHGSEYLTTTEKELEGTVSFKLNHNSASSRLFSKFVIAVMLDGEFVDISRGHYITNPEAIAKYTYSHPKTSSIKGLGVDPAKLGGNELTDLGVKQAGYNIPIGYILGETTNGIYPTIYYKYNGKTYAFNGQRIAEFDLVFSSLTAKGIVTTVVLLNDINPSYMQMVHPNARGGKANYYMFNGADSSGVDYLAAVSTFLAGRYSGTQHGQVVNWVIGNEINARATWNYMDYTSVAEYTEAYAQAFRVFYTGIKSVNANARVYISLDQTWDRNLNERDTYDAKDILDAFNSNISLKGNIDWSIAHHPYPVPLTWPKFWDMPANYKRMNLVQNSVSTPFVTIQNIHVLTDYIQQDAFLNENGEVRSVILSEVGFGSDHGETLQAAAYSYAYYIAEANQHIDALILNKQTDMAVEIAQGLSFGLNRTDGSHKYIYNVFKNIDTSASADVTAFAKEIIGISDWSSVITRR